MEFNTASLESLFATITENAPDNNTRESLQWLPIEFLQRGKYQPRQEFKQETLQELANSIQAQGIIQPIVVRELNKNKFEIIAGERRSRPQNQRPGSRQAESRKRNGTVHQVYKALEPA